jgi:spore maturation protein SpmA
VSDLIRKQYVYNYAIIMLSVRPSTIRLMPDLFERMRNNLGSEIARVIIKGRISATVSSTHYAAIMLAHFDRYVAP